MSWYNASWLYRTKVTLYASKAGGATQTDFPVCITQEHVPSLFWDAVLSTGADIVVTSDDGATKLKRELATFNAATPVMELHVRVPSYSHSVDTVVYLYYGNAAGAETNDTDSWRAEYEGVYHGNDYPGDNTRIWDSTANARHGTKSNAESIVEASGSIGKHQAFNGDGSYISAALPVIGVGDFTVFVLTRSPAWVERNAMLYSGAAGSTNKGLWGIILEKSTVYGFFCDGSATRIQLATKSFNATYHDNTWATFALALDRDVAARHYQNGAQIGTDDTSITAQQGNVNVNGINPPRIGERVSGSATAHDIGEYRVSSCVWSAEWRAAEDAWLRTNSQCYEMGAVERFEGITLDGILVDRLSSAPTLDGILTEAYEAPRGLLHVDAVGILAQLDTEAVIDYTASAKGIHVIVAELLALQVNPVPLTAGTIDYTSLRSITVDKDTILGVLKRLQESVGGYIYVDSSKALQWRTTIGSDVGQQLRFGKNLMSIRRTTDYSELANRIYCYGAGAGETLIRLGKKTVTVIPLSTDDTAGKGYVDGAWVFSKTSTSSYVGRRTASASLTNYGGGIRFPNVAIAQGLTILKAELRLTSYGSGVGSDLSSKMWGQNVDNAAAFTDVTDYNTRLDQKTTALYTDPAVTAWTGGQQYTFSVRTVVQEIVNRVGWVSGNAMALFWEDHEGRTSVQSYRRYLTTGDGAPVLYIEATDPAMADYIEDAASQNTYGYASCPPLVDKSITESDTLFEWATRQLGERAYPVVSYQGMLADLERYGFSFDALALGNQVRIKDEAIDMNALTRIIRLRRNLTDRMDVGVELANRAPTVLDKLQFAKDPRWRQHFY